MTVSNIENPDGVLRPNSPTFTREFLEGQLSEIRWRPAPIGNPWAQDELGESYFQIAHNHIERVTQAAYEVIDQFAGAAAEDVKQAVASLAFGEILRRHIVNYRETDLINDSEMAEVHLKAKEGRAAVTELVTLLRAHQELEALELAKETHGGNAENRPAMPAALLQLLKLTFPEMEIKQGETKIYFIGADNFSSPRVVSLASKTPLGSFSDSPTVVYRTTDVVNLDQIAPNVCSKELAKFLATADKSGSNDTESDESGVGGIEIKLPDSLEFTSYIKNLQRQNLTTPVFGVYPVVDVVYERALSEKQKATLKECD